MKLNRKLVLVAALVLSVALATTGTLAYLTDSDMDKNVMTLGRVEIVQNEQERTEDGTLDEFTQNQPVFPAVYDAIQYADEKLPISGGEYNIFSDDMKNVMDKIVTVTNTGKSDAYVRTIVAIEAPEGFNDDLIHVNVNDAGMTIKDWNYYTINGVRYIARVWTYDEPLAPDATSTPSLLQVFLDKETTNEDLELLGDALDIVALSQAVQAEGFDNAEKALNDGFGEVTAENLLTWLTTTEEGSPGEKWPNNNPPSPNTVYVKNEAELRSVLENDSDEVKKAIFGDNITLVDTMKVIGDVVIDLNGYDLDASGNDSRPFEMTDGSSLVINAENEAIACGPFGLINIPQGNDTKITLNGGNYTGELDNGAFIRPRGDAEVIINLNDVNFSDTAESQDSYVISVGPGATDGLTVNIVGGEYVSPQGIMMNYGTLKMTDVELTSTANDGYGITSYESAIIAIVPLSPNSVHLLWAIRG